MCQSFKHSSSLLQMWILIWCGWCNLFLPCCFIGKNLPLGLKVELSEIATWCSVLTLTNSLPVLSYFHLALLLNYIDWSSIFMFASSSVDWYDVIYDNAGPSWIGVEVLWGWVGIWSALLVPVSVEFGHSYFSVLLSWSLFSCLLCFLGLIVAFSLPWFFESGLFCPLLYSVILFSFY